MQLRPFEIERYYTRYEFSTRFMLSSSDCESRSVADVLALEPGSQERLLDQWCGYTESPGASELREAIASIYESITPDDVVVATCAEEGIFLLYHALLGTRDHAIVETPCYQSALEVARSTGAAVSKWERRFAANWPFDVDALAALVRPNTRVLYVNQPHNPTGTLMPRETFDQVVALTLEHGIRLFCDEVYRELEHDPAIRLPAACDIDERAVSLGSISKTYGLPGLRIGWLATRDAKLRARLIDLKHYTTICASAPSELLTAIALRHREQLVERSHAIVSRNLPLLADLFARQADRFEWVRPVASPIGFPRVHGLGDVDAFCARLATEADVLLLPGSVYEQPEHVRVGYGRANMPEALERLDAFLERPG